MLGGLVSLSRRLDHSRTHRLKLEELSQLIHINSCIWGNPQLPVMAPFPPCSPVPTDSPKAPQSPGLPALPASGMSAHIGDLFLSYILTSHQLPGRGKSTRPLGKLRLLKYCHPLKWLLGFIEQKAFPL